MCECAGSVRVWESNAASDNVFDAKSTDTTGTHSGDWGRSLAIFVRRIQWKMTGRMKTIMPKQAAPTKDMKGAKYGTLRGLWG